jgi:hypothetical protein
LYAGSQRFHGFHGFQGHRSAPVPSAIAECTIEIDADSDLLVPTDATAQVYRLNDGGRRNGAAHAYQTRESGRDFARFIALLAMLPLPGLIAC